ncbi:MAG TPA: FAD-dependent monooxygenase [Pseudonocardiaceae bacterium]
MTDTNDAVDVLIVGGGPVGLTARALLARWGTRTLLVEKYRKLSPFPRSRLVNVRSMEIFRGLGLAEQIAALAFPPAYGRVSFRETLLDQDFASDAMVGINAPIPESPALGAVTSQDRLEPTLLGATDAPVRFGAELVDLIEEAEHVVAVLVEDGKQTRVRARYVLAADGANSTVRQRLGIGTTGPGALARTTTVLFDADLERWSAEHPAGAIFTSHGSFGPLYPEGGWFWSANGQDETEDTDWAAAVSRAIGDGDIPVKVSRAQQWVVNAFIAERFRHGRVLLAGDAVHAVPPIGGMGMNTGLADVHNLCWKLAGVLRGWAGPSLLDTYEPERQPVAAQTLEQTVANTRLLMQAVQRRQEQLKAGDIDGAVTVPWSDRYFNQLDLVLGVRYSSSAVLTDSAGHRLPHQWLAEGRSSLDAVGEWFTLFTPDQADRRTSGWPLRVESLPGAEGALLVRPDGHVAARWSTTPDDATLAQALAAVTGAD